MKKCLLFIMFGLMSLSLSSDLGACKKNSDCPKNQVCYTYNIFTSKGICGKGIINDVSDLQASF